MQDGQGPASPPTARVLDVVEALAGHPERAWTLADLVRTTGMTRATAHAVLTTLAERGWVHRSEIDKTFTIGSYLAVLGRELARSRPLERLAHEAVAKVAVQQDTVVFVVHHVGDAIVVTDVATPPGRTSGVVVGNKVPFLPPFGPGFAAWATPAERATWLAHAQRINPALATRLDQVLPAIRDRGYSLERTDAAAVTAFEVLARLQDDVFGEAVREVIGKVLADLGPVDFLPGELRGRGRFEVTSIAAPVFDADGTVALNLAVQPRGSLTRGELESLGSALVDAATEVTRSIGGEAP